MKDNTDHIAAGQAALKAAHWPEAKLQFESALQVADTPEAHDGLDQWFFETGTPASALTLPPPAAEPPDVAAIIASLKAYGTDTLGPPPQA